MSKYVNPIGFRLGLLRLWNMTFNIYGKDFKIYNQIFFKQESLQIYIQKLFKFYRIFTVMPTSCINPKYSYLIIYNFKLPKTKKVKLYFILQKIQKVYYFLMRIPLINLCYTQKNWSNTSLFLLQYVKFLFEVKKIPLKFIINRIEPLLLKTLKKKIIYSTISNFRVSQINGIKICCKGCLSNLRNPLAQTLKKSWGSVSLSTINKHIDYSQGNILTKRGSYGIKIWIFYS